MKILGVGIIFAQGLGISSLEKALRNGWQKPAEVPVPRCGDQKAAVYQVDLDAVTDRTLLKKIRRSDKLSKMCVLAASDALIDSGIENISQKRIGIILASAFGPHVTTFGFLDGIIDYGDAAVSPTMFSNSVHNAATSYISMSLDIKGPTLTITQFRLSFQAAMQLAETWLSQGRCDFILAGAVDQYGDVLGYVSDQKLNTAKDGKIKPFTFKPTCQVPGEGAVFFLLSKEGTGNTYCSISAVYVNDGQGLQRQHDISIIDTDGMLPDESAYLSWLSPGIPVSAYSPLFGSMMIGSAFNLAAAALMLKQQSYFAAPVLDNPHNLQLVNETRTTRIESICCLGCNCFGEKTVIYLSRQ
jgi:3-oxoacyl-[acyl-carrier-protein] synthase II